MIDRPSFAAAILAILALGGFAGSGAALAGSAAGIGPDFASRVVREQNEERLALGMRKLSWDPKLAVAADGYAAELAASDKWEHSANERRPGQGENLWMGTRSAFNLEFMVGEWLAERKAFRPGTFPQVSATGRWEDVGHYTQIIWPETLRVGCALRSSAQFDYLVCRYSAAGNVMGQPVRPVALASR